MKNNTMKTTLILATLSLLLSVNNKVEAAIYKCVNVDGETYYNDKVCPKSTNQTELNNVKDPVGGYIPPAFTESSKEKEPKGIVIGKQVDANSANSSLKKINEDGKSSNGSGALNSSNENDSNVNENNGYTEVVSELDLMKASAENARNNTESLPTIPLKVNNNTKEAARFFTK